MSFYFQEKEVSLKIILVNSAQLKGKQNNTYPSLKKILDLSLILQP